MTDDIAMLLRNMYLEGVSEFSASVRVKRIDIANSLVGAVEGLVEPDTVQLWSYMVQSHDWRPMLLVTKKDRRMLGYLIRVYKATLLYSSGC